VARGRFYQINQYIRAEKVRVIDQNGKQVGVMPIKEALEKAQKVGLDLVEVAPKAQPPVCKIINFHKFIYQQKKKKKGIKTKKQPELKQIRLKLFIEKHDLDRRIKEAQKFLKNGDRVKFNILFRGREITKKEFAFTLLEEIKNKLSATAEIVQEPKLKGKILEVTFKAK